MFKPIYNEYLQRVFTTNSNESKLKILLFSSILISSLLFSNNLYCQLTPDAEVSEEPQCTLLNEFLDQPSNTIQSKIKEVKNAGRVIFDITTDDPILSATDFISLVNLGSDYSFQESYTSDSNGRIITRYQQYYNNIAIENGGFAFIGTDPCEGISAVAYLQSNINTQIENDIEFSELGGIVEGNVEDAQIILSPIHLNQCSLKLVWKTIFLNANGHQIAWVDANSGEILKIRDADDRAFNNALESETKTTLNKSNTFNSSTPGPINIYDLSALVGNHPTVEGTCSMSVPDLLSATLICPAGSGTTPQSTLFANISAVTGCLGAATAPLGPITYGTINAGVGCGACDQNAVDFPSTPASLSGSNTTTANITFPACTVIMTNETIAHELGHAYLNEFFLSTTSDTHAALHEYFADMFSEYAGFLGCGTLDWEFGNEGGILIAYRRKFNLNENDGCFSNYQLDDPDTEENEFDRYDFGNPLRKLSYLMVTEVDANGNSVFSFPQLMTMVTDALSIFPANGTFHDFVDLLLDDVDDNFGFCSPQSLLLRQSLHEVCLGNIFNGCQINIGGTSTTQSTINGLALSVCEESGFFRLFVPDASNDIAYSWTGTIPTWSVNGQTNPNQITGNQIFVEFGDFTWYPRIFNICVNAPQLQTGKVCMDVIINDCENDDPSCDDVFAIPEDNVTISKDENFSLKKSKDEINLNQALYVKVYDISGRLIYEGNFDSWNTQKENISHQGIIFSSLFDGNMRLIKTEKQFILNNNQ